MGKIGRLPSKVAVFALTLMVIITFDATTANGQGSYALAYNLNYTLPAYPGGSTTLVNIFTNSGSVLERVTGLTVTVDFGTYTASSGLPLNVGVGQKQELNMTEQVPSSASVGLHPATARVDFQYQDPSTLQWVTPSTSPLSVQGGIQLTSNPGGLAAIGFVILGVIAALAFAVVFLVVRMRRKPKPTPPAMPPVVPSSPPVQP